MAMKLAFADREAYHEDSSFCDVPLERLFAEQHLRARRALIGEQVSLEQRPSVFVGYEHLSEGVIE